MVYMVFVFKQKTAYEMRISDWSSDVCSSDLRPAAHAHQAPATQIPLPRRASTHRARNASPTASVDRVAPATPHRAGLAGRPHPLANEIGRASCRERVCQYV